MFFRPSVAHDMLAAILGHLLLNFGHTSRPPLWALADIGEITWSPLPPTPSERHTASYAHRVEI